MKKHEQKETDGDIHHRGAEAQSQAELGTHMGNGVVEYWSHGQAKLPGGAHGVHALPRALESWSGANLCGKITVFLASQARHEMGAQTGWFACANVVANKGD